jgi:hypothetical protein
VCGGQRRYRKRPAPVLGRPRAMAGAFVGGLERGLKLSAEVEDERPPVKTVSRRLVTPAGLWDDPREVADLLQDRDRAANPGLRRRVPRAQCAISTGTVAAARMWLVAPPKIIWRSRLWV